MTKELHCDTIEIDYLQVLGSSEVVRYSSWYSLTVDCSWLASLAQLARRSKYKAIPTYAADTRHDGYEESLGSVLDSQSSPLRLVGSCERIGRVNERLCC